MLRASVKIVTVMKHCIEKKYIESIFNSKGGLYFVEDNIYI